MKTTITRRAVFCAGHRLHNSSFSEEKNREIFGECSSPNGHGHNYTLEVSVTGDVDPQTGMVINLKELKQIIESEIISRVDHKNLNVDVDFMQGVIPTAEGLAAKIWEILDVKIADKKLAKIVLWESENNRVEVSR